MAKTLKEMLAEELLWDNVDGNHSILNLLQLIEQIRNKNECRINPHGLCWEHNQMRPCLQGVAEVITRDVKMR